MKYVLAYADEITDKAEEVNKQLVECGCVNAQDSAHDAKEALKNADILFVFVTEETQVDLPAVRSAWEFFDAEIRWKRKTAGEILFLAPADDVLKNLPLRLKKYGYFLTDEIEDAAAYCEDKLREADEKSKQAEAVPPVKQIRYSPPEDTVQQIEFSVRAPRIESFDGGKTYQGEENDACKQDHSFDDNTSRHDGQSGACRDDHVFGYNDGGLHSRSELAARRKQKRNTVLLVLVVIVLLSVALAIIFKVASLYDAAKTAATFERITPIFDQTVSAGKGANALQCPPQCDIIREKVCSQELFRGILQR